MDVSIPFTLIHPVHGKYCDALYFKQEDYDLLSPEDIEAKKQQRLNNWVYRIEHAQELYDAEVNSPSATQGFIDQFPKTESMQLVHSKVTDASLGIAAVKEFKEETLYLLECPDFVFMGKEADIANVNTAKCSFDAVPIVRDECLGGVYLFEADKNILVYLITKNEFEEPAFRSILASTLKSLNVPNISIRANDILSGTMQVGMTAPPVKLENGMFYTVGQVTFGVDFRKVNDCLFFPTTKWDDKADVTAIEDWIKPLGDFGITISSFITALQTTFKAMLKVELVVKDAEIDPAVESHREIR